MINETPIPDLIESKKKHYFVNEIVEMKLTKYIWTGCTDVELRDSIMTHANELIIQLIRKQGLFNIYRGHDSSAFNELVHVAYMQIERTLYKYRSQPHCRNCFNYDRPNQSILYKPAQFEFGIITPEKLVKLVPKCPHCGSTLTNSTIVEPAQGLFGGNWSVLYRGMSKVFNMWCIAPDSLLITNDGITTIQNVVDNKISKVQSPIGLVNINGYLEKPKQHAIKIIIEKNYNITSSYEHRFWVMKNEDGCYSNPNWEYAAYLSIGDLMAIQCGQNNFINDDYVDFTLTSPGDWQPPAIINEELAYIIGLFIAEGSYSYGKLVIYNVDQEIIDRLISNTLGLNFIHEPEFQRISLCNVRFIEFLRLIGFPEQTSAESKFIPRKMLRCSKNIISCMISGMFDGDGHSRKLDGNVGYTSCSRFLLDQLKMILLNFGMLTKEHEDKRTIRDFGDYVSNIQPSWQLELPTESSKLFYDIIGFGLTRKQNNKQFLKKSQETLYGISDRFHSLYQKYGPGKLGYDYCRTVIVKNCRSLNNAIDKLKSWEDFSHDEDYKFIQDRINEASSGIKRTVWLPVKELLEVKSNLCEISVDSEEHSYIANGFISHNSQVSRTVILAHVKKDTRDLRNTDSYTDFVTRKPLSGDNKQYNKIMTEVKSYLWFNDDYCKVVDALIELSAQLDPDKNFKKKISNIADVDRKTVDNALLLIRVIMKQCVDGFSHKNMRCVDEAIF